MTLSSLNDLNLKEIGGWQPMQQAVALGLLFVLLVAAGYWFDTRSQIDELHAAKAQEATLREKFLQKKKIAVNYTVYKKQLADIERSLGRFLQQLPNKSEMDNLLTDINQAGIKRNLEFELFRPAKDETLTEYYAELPISIKVTGRYHDMGAFASAIAQLPRIVTLNDIHISGKSEHLTMEATAHTYRYLDAAEQAAQKKAAARNKGAKKTGGGK